MKEQEIDVLSTVKSNLRSLISTEKRKFNTLINKALAPDRVRSEKILHISGVKFTFYIGPYKSIIAVNDNIDNLIFITDIPKQIKVVDVNIVGKEIVYNLRHGTMVNETITNDILKSFIKDI